ncbi:MAG: GAF domain-containing protein [Chloroflexota bacterium]
MDIDYLSRSPTGQEYAPVCIGDIKAYQFQASANDLTEDVAKHLQAHPEVPGVMLVDGKDLIGVIPRHKMFERLGRRYGVELFLRKPIISLQKDLGTELFFLPHFLRVQEAVQQALQRNILTIYDPIVVVFPDKSFQLLDMYDLLMVQSKMLEAMNGVINSISRLDEAMRNKSPEHALETVLDALRHAVPFHQISLLVLGFENFPFLKLIKGPIRFPGDILVSNPIYKSIFDNQQTICLDDVLAVPTWQGINGASQARSWMGIPLVDQHGFLGILSLSRLVVSPFNNNEKDMSTVFAWYFSQILSNMIRPHVDENFPLKHVPVKKERFQQPVIKAARKSNNLTI